MRPATLPDPAFIEELNGASHAQSAPVVDLTARGDVASERTANMSGREGSESSKSTSLTGEPIQSYQCGCSQPLRINGILVYRMVDMEMVDRAGDRPVYMVDYFTSTVTPQYLESLREEFGIPNDVEMMVLRPNDLVSRPLPGYITLSAKFFRAGLRLPFHPFLRRAL